MNCCDELAMIELEENKIEDRESNEFEEVTPLLRIPSPIYDTDTSWIIKTMVKVCFLSLIFTLGVSIAIYLLVLQAKSEKPLPDPTIRTHTVYDGANRFRERRAAMDTNKTFITETNTTSCVTDAECQEVLRSLWCPEDNKGVFHLLVTHNGSILFPNWMAPHEHGLRVGLLGHFNNTEPTEEQVNAAVGFLEDAVKEGILRRDFEMFVPDCKLHKFFEQHKNICECN